MQTCCIKTTDMIIGHHQPAQTVTNLGIVTSTSSHCYAHDDDASLAAYVGFKLSRAEITGTLRGGVGGRGMGDFLGLIRSLLLVLN